MGVSGISYSMLKKIEETIAKFRMLEKGDKVLIAFSGGPDSSVLLYVLNELKKKYDISIYAGHVNHGLRGKESLEDERIAKKICEELKIPCSVIRKNVKKLKKRGNSLENTARKIRYEALGKIAKTFGANKIATGHNRDDQVETILFRIIRGTGEEGLGGIPPTRKFSPGIEIIRPLIEIEREKIEKYLKLKKIKPRIDSSNLDVSFLRNRIRHELIPYLEKYNPKIKESLLRISQISRENSEYIRQNTHKILKQISTHLPGVVRIDIDKLLSYSPNLRNHILRKAIREFKEELSYSNLIEIQKIIDSKRANLVLYLSPKLKVVKEYTSLFIKKVRGPERVKNEKSLYYVFEKEGEFPIPEIKKTICIDYIKRNNKTSIDFNDSSEIYLDADKIKFPLILRIREEGDRFRPFGMKGEKKLKDFFIDEKIPLEKRGKIPILVTGAGKILWAVGYRRSNLGIITKKTSKIIRIRLK
jgi:tRNA(Ile)-lysidine synthase